MIIHHDSRTRCQVRSIFSSLGFISPLYVFNTIPGNARYFRNNLKLFEILVFQTEGIKILSSLSGNSRNIIFREWVLLFRRDSGVCVVEKNNFIRIFSAVITNRIGWKIFARFHFRVWSMVKRKKAGQRICTRVESYDENFSISCDFCFQSWLEVYGSLRI